MSSAPARLAAQPVKRIKPGALFLITISLTSSDEFTRSDLLSAFEADAISYCIALEKSSEKSQVSLHIHAFFELSEKMFVNDVRMYVESLFDGCKIDVQAARSKRNCLIYISKEDMDLLTNVSRSKLNFNYQCYWWARENDCFNVSHPFVMKHRFCYKFLERVFYTVKQNVSNNFVGLRPVYSCYMNWTLDVCMWWNKWYDCFKLKRPALYLYGLSNVGKSTFIERIIGADNMPYVFYPDVGKFFMQSFEEKFHKVILFEEFEYKFAVLSLLKRLLEGRSYSYPVKCGVAKMITFKGPIIFVSNDNDVTDDAMRNRMMFVSASSPYWEAPLAVVPKVEEAEKENMEEIYEIE